MHYYYHNIKDFRAGCHNMESRLERWIYRDMIDAYYDREAPFPDDIKQICAILGLRREEEREIVAGLLVLKFEQTERGWVHERCEEEIAKYHANAEVARLNGQRGGRPKGSKKPSGFPSGSSLVPDGLPSGSHPEPAGGQTAPTPKANQEPITNNHKPEEDQNHVEPEGPTAMPAVQMVFAYWQKVMDKPRAQLDAKRKRCIAGRLKDGYTVEQLCQAVDGCRADPFSMGKNDRSTPYNDIELICRDGARVDRFIGIANRPVMPRSSLGVHGQATAANAMEWLEENAHD